MRKLICTAIFAGALLILNTAAAQPMAPPAATAAPMTVTAMSAAKPVAPVAVTAMAAKVPSPAAAPTVAPEMAVAESVVTATPTEKPKAETPVWKTAGFWIGVVGGPLLSIILAILVAFGVIKKKWLTYLREKEIIKIADKAASSLEAYAKSTDAKWDDILAQAVKAVITRMGELTEDEKKLVENVIKDREEQAKIGG